jgi:hypothetical protein
MSIALYMRILLFVESFDFRPKPMHFGERHSQLLPFCEYVFAPDKSPVEVQTEIFDIFLLRKMYTVYMDWAEGFSSCGGCNMD